MFKGKPVLIGSKENFAHCGHGFTIPQRTKAGASVHTHFGCVHNVLCFKHRTPMGDRWEITAKTVKYGDTTRT